jgi:hypothetical protein
MTFDVFTHQCHAEGRGAGRRGRAPLHKTLEDPLLVAIFHSLVQTCSYDTHDIDFI